MDTFISSITSLPEGASLDPVLQSAIEYETELRRLFANDKANPILNDNVVGLIDVFNAPEALRKTRARVVKDKEDLTARYIMPLDPADRRKNGVPSVVSDLSEFKKTWNIFSEGSLSQLMNWDNVVVAGGSVLACLMPLPETARVSKRATRKYYHNQAYPTSDVDIFLYGMTPEQAEVKINEIYEAVRDSVPWDTTVIRTNHTLSIHSQYPYRSVQIVLRLYRSTAEILAGFDVDAPCCAFDGTVVWANPRALVALMRQCNTTDVTRRSPSYEVRLAKYASRGFEVYVPSLRRKDVDPTIYERSIVRIEGLARLLVLEKLADPIVRESFLSARRTLRGRPNANTSLQHKRTLKGDLKADTAMAGLAMNDYDVSSLHIPYGPGWDARRIDKLVYQTDLGMNSTFNPKNKGRRLHRHPAFFGTMLEALEDCCEHCPEPLDEAEKKLQEEDDKNYIRGRVAFMEENPGRQTISGSFNPIDDGEWTTQAYIGPIAKFFAAIASHNRDAVSTILKEGGDSGTIDVNRRDHVGRAPLHVAIICKAADIACDLVDAGARITARLVDGRTSLHLAAQYGLIQVVKKLLERSAVNKEEAAAAKEKEKDGENEKKGDGSDMSEDGDGEKSTAPGPKSSEDDWSSSKEDMDVDMDDDEDGEQDEDEDGEMDVCGEDGDGEGDDDDEGSDGEPRRRKKKAAKEADPAVASAESGEIPVDNEEELDVLEIDTHDWDMAFTPLSYAILYSDLPLIEVLLTAGADVKHIPKVKNGVRPFHPLTLSILVESDQQASAVAERLILAGARSSTADSDARTIFHQAVTSNRVPFVNTLLRCDPKAKIALDFPVIDWNSLQFPIVSSIAAGHSSMTALLLAHGAKISWTSEELSKARAIADPKNRWRHGKHYANLPIETALARTDEIVHLLAGIGANVSDLLVECRAYYDGSNSNITLLDYTRLAIKSIGNQILVVLAAEATEAAKGKEVPSTTPASTWTERYFLNLARIEYAQHTDKIKNEVKPTDADQRKSLLFHAKDYFIRVEKILLAHGAKTYLELHPEATVSDHMGEYIINNRHKREPPAPRKLVYGMHTDNYNSLEAPEHIAPLYEQLFQACYTGNAEKIKALCLPMENATPNTPGPIQISAQTMNPNKRWKQNGETPLSVAIMTGRWDIARLVMSIAATQYVPDSKKNKFSFNLDLDSDRDSEESGSDDDSDAESVKYTDIAARPSAVQCQIPPKKMLIDVQHEWPSTSERDHPTACGNLLKESILNGDFEAFVQIADLYKSLPKPVSLEDGRTLNLILQYERVEFLDEYIRRTGAGVDTVVAPATEGEVSERKVDTSKATTYLGLSVHGKKRHDLVSRTDPDALVTSDPGPDHPLLWLAAAQGSKSIVEYLGGDRPLAAYKYYAATHSDERATRLRKTTNLDVVLPEWLGWRISELSESPLTAAILGGKVEIVKAMFAKSPKLMASTLHERVKFVGYNPVMLACHMNSSVELVDFLLSKTVSATENDQIRRYNILHKLASSRRTKLLKHILDKLPDDVTEILLAQQSKRDFNTPLHLAVYSGHSKVVQVLLDTKLCDLRLRDVDGCTPLHIAVQKGYSKMAETLARESPIEVLHSEDGIGHTPLETASLLELQERTGTKYTEFARNPPKSLKVSSQPKMNKVDLPFLEKEVPKLRSTIEQLVSEGRLHQHTKTTKQMLAFADRAEAQLAMHKQAAENEVVVVEKPKDGEDGADKKDRGETLRVIRELIAVGAPTVRQLVHLIDVQKSVQANLTKVVVGGQRRARQAHVDDDGLEPEKPIVDARTKLKAQSHVLKMVHCLAEGDSDSEGELRTSDI